MITHFRRRNWTWRRASPVKGLVINFTARFKIMIRTRPATLAKRCLANWPCCRTCRDQAAAICRLRQTRARLEACAFLPASASNEGLIVLTGSCLTFSDLITSDNSQRERDRITSVMTRPGKTSFRIRGSSRKNRIYERSGHTYTVENIGQSAEFSFAALISRVYRQIWRLSPTLAIIVR